ncbi:hypothetical protein GCM10009639_47090 [Kitasatospora putterlickiae]|uniref:Uncharacterized protein n=1 Tax=Kitasatospora putterlickiae TaxID=221725 RepID=A0ABN1YCW5_9ACTN
MEWKVGWADFLFRWGLPQLGVWSVLRSRARGAVGVRGEWKVGRADFPLRRGPAENQYVDRSAYLSPGVQAQ